MKLGADIKAILELIYAAAIHDDSDVRLWIESFSRPTGFTQYLKTLQPSETKKSNQIKKSKSRKQKSQTQGKRSIADEINYLLILIEEQEQENITAPLQKLADQLRTDSKFRICRHI
jgi:hypothetical protein